MRTRIRKLVTAAGALAGAMLVLEPGVNATQQLDAAQWQLYWGSEYNYCEGCCGVGFCCNIGRECIIIID